MSPESLALVRLNLVPGLGPGRIDRLVRRFGCADAAFAASSGGWREAGVPPAIAEVGLSEESARELEREVERAARLGARILTIAESTYPAPLRTIPLPPPVLYARGHPELLE